MNPFKILVVEDDRSVSNLITTTLKLNQYSYLRASGGQEAVSICASAKPDLILLDLGLPDMDGISVIETIRSWSQVPIIVITARSEETDKISALDSGADDYLTKPFSVDELMARIRVSQRRIQYQPASEETVFINGELSIDFASAEVKVRDNVVHLTPIEYKLLCLLARNTGKVLTHTYIISNIWGTGIDNDIVSLRVYMTSLRKKLNTENDLIRTHIGIGYQMIRI